MSRKRPQVLGAVPAICFVLCASTLLLYQYQAPEPIRTKPNKLLVTSITSLVVGIFIARQQLEAAPSPMGSIIDLTTTFEISKGYA